MSLSTHTPPPDPRNPPDPRKFPDPAEDLLPKASSAGQKGEPAGDAAAGRPLCVDLDGTLVATDTAWESILLLLRHRPMEAALLPIVALRGEAHLKRWLAQRIIPDAATLPYRDAVLAFLRQEKLAGRKIILATAADANIAQAVADHLGLFDQVIATDGHNNCKGANKRQAIADALGAAAFDYIGDSRADLPVWAAAEQAHLVNPSQRVYQQVQNMAQVGKVFRDGPASGWGRALILAMRPHQWIKNLLLAVPMLVGQQVADPHRWLLLAAAILTFSLTASALYLINDLLDLPADRAHPIKRRRPLASGALPIPLAMALALALLVAGPLLAVLWLPKGYLAALGAYAVLAGAYSLWVKGQAVLDVLWLAGLYTLRLIAGGVAVDVFPSAWLLGFAVFLFLSLAFVKRYAELAMIQQNQGQQALGRGYHVDDLGLVGVVGPVSGYLAVLVFALYINSQAVLELYQKPQLLWLICPLLLYWITRLWLLAHRKQLRDDPFLFAVTDPATYVVAALTAGIAAAAALG